MAVKLPEPGSMRAIGYSFEAAVADILDNSVSASSTSVQIWFSPYGVPYIAIVDDGQRSSYSPRRTLLSMKTRGECCRTR
jgi:hypothetical protein